MDECRLHETKYVRKRINQANKGEYTHYKPFATINPPSTKTSSNEKVPKAFTTTCVLPSAEMKRKRDKAI